MSWVFVLTGLPRQLHPGYPTGFSKAYLEDFYHYKSPTTNKIANKISLLHISGYFRNIPCFILILLL